MAQKKIKVKGTTVINTQERVIESGLVTTFVGEKFQQASNDIFFSNGKGFSWSRKFEVLLWLSKWGYSTRTILYKIIRGKSRGKRVIDRAIDWGFVKANLVEIDGENTTVFTLTKWGFQALRENLDYFILFDEVDINAITAREIQSHLEVSNNAATIYQLERGAA